jgi:hypothetical protein
MISGRPERGEYADYAQSDIDHVAGDDAVAALTAQGQHVIGEVFRYEFAHRLRSISTWLYAGFLLLISFWVIHVAATGTNPIYVNAPQGLAETTALFCGLFGILVTAGLFSDAAIRDRAAGMDALLFTTRLRPAEYLRGRFLAALAINSILVFAIPIGLAVATQMPYLPRDAIRPGGRRFGGLRRGAMVGVFGCSLKAGCDDTWKKQKQTKRMWWTRRASASFSSLLPPADGTTVAGLCWTRVGCADCQLCDLRFRGMDCLQLDDPGDVLVAWRRRQRAFVSCVMVSVGRQ